MIPRRFNLNIHNDGPAIERFINAGHPLAKTIANPYLDEIFVLGESARPLGVLVYRPGAIVHELECGGDASRRLRATSLSNFAIGHAKACGLKSATFLVKGDNHAMIRFVESLGAVKQSDPGDLLYILTP